jgi:alpha-tubulin suppressor-like RCC1 family protein
MVMTAFGNEPRVRFVDLGDRADMADPAMWLGGVALSAAGHVWAWGQNSFGQVGDGSGVERRTPVRLASISGIVAIGTGRLHTLAVGSGGGVWAWGDNHFGQLGDGTKTDRRAPVRVGGITTGEQVAGGRDYSVALVG